VLRATSDLFTGACCVLPFTWWGDLQIQGTCMVDLARRPGILRARLAGVLAPVTLGVNVTAPLEASAQAEELMQLELERDTSA
jgi:hypothetical protein